MTWYGQRKSKLVAQQPKEVPGPPSHFQSAKDGLAGLERSQTVKNTHLQMSDAVSIMVERYR